jgi:hypothetical protein
MDGMTPERRRSSRADRFCDAFRNGHDSIHQDPLVAGSRPPAD